MVGWGELEWWVGVGVFSNISLYLHRGRNSVDPPRNSLPKRACVFHWKMDSMDLCKDKKFPDLDYQ